MKVINATDVLRRSLIKQHDAALKCQLRYVGVTAVISEDYFT